MSDFYFFFAQMNKTIKQNILITVDNVIFTIIDDKLHVLLIKRLIEPFKDSWTIPGGFVLEEENLEQAAHRELQEKTNVKGVYLEQLYTFSDPKRDPRGRVISATYMALVARDNIVVKTGSYASDAKFIPVNKLPKLAFDHKKIVDYAIKRLKWKFEYTNVAQYILPAKFTLSQLQKVYETVCEQKFDVRNFRKKIDKLGIVKETGEKER